jgi:hypothetical protein
MKRRSEPSLKLQVYLPAWLKKEVDDKAADAGQSVSTWVERALASLLKAKAAPER